MGIYDCFMYFDEDLITDLRFNILQDRVDKFVIVEATRDHAGNEKKLNFNIKNFKKFENKIIYHVVDDIPKKVTNYKKGWSENFYRENFHRNSISNAIKNCNENDLILISDADEIPNLKMLDSIKIKKYALFSQKNFYYKLNLQSPENWLGTGACYKKFLNSPQWLRNKRFLRRGFLRRIFFKTQIINNGGWHFSFLKTPEEIKKKMQSYGHGEHQQLSTVDNIVKNIEAKTFFINTDIKLKKIEIDESYPEYIKKNKKFLLDWISN